MKLKRLEFILSETAATDGSRTKAHLLKYLNESGFKVKGREVYFKNKKQGYIEPTTLLANSGTEFEEFCRIYEPVK